MPPIPRTVLLVVSGLSDFWLTVLGEKSWVFALGDFSDRGLWCSQCSAGILGAVPYIFSHVAECCTGMLMPLATLFCPSFSHRFISWAQLNSVSLVLPLVRSCPDLCQDSCPVVWTSNCLVPGAAFVIAMNHIFYQSCSCWAEHWTEMRTHMVLATEIK